MRVEVDGDVVAFRAGFGAEHVEYDITYKEPNFGEDILITCRYKKEADEVVARLAEQGTEAEITPRRVLEPLAHALHNVASILTGIMDTLSCGRRDMRVWISGPSDQNFRKQVATIKPYKGNRKDAWRPTYEKEIKDYIVRRWRGTVTEGQEADDAMGIAQCEVSFGQSCIVTNDKDLDMIPGLHYNFVTDERYVVDEQTAAWVFWRQMLTGDSTDNILGIPGIGEKKSYDLLAEIWDSPSHMRDKVWSLYVQTYGLTAWPAFVENGQLLWIRRQEGQLWEPSLLC
jgi:hypothetical protein